MDLLGLGRSWVVDWFGDVVLVGEGQAYDEGLVCITQFNVRMSSSSSLSSIEWIAFRKVLD